jgi:WD40 repeat protein
MVQKIFIMLVSAVLFATGCGPIKNKPKDEKKDINISGLNSGLGGAVYFDSNQNYTRLELGSGNVETFFTTAPNMTWLSNNAERFVTIQRSNYRPQAVIFAHDKVEVLRFDLPENPDAAPKLSRQGDMVLIGGIAGDTVVFDLKGKIVGNIRANISSYDWLPDGRIIFSRFATIYIMEKDFKTYNVFREMKGSVRGISVSPEGGRIAFSMNETGIAHIWVMDLASTQFRQLTTSTVGEHLPTWSPDGDSILLAKGKLHIDNRILVEKKQECMELWAVSAHAGISSLNAEDAASLRVKQNAAGKVSETCALSAPQWRSN